MHPAFSVIFFTVSSGAGFGLFALLYLADIFGLGGALPVEQKLIAGILALVLVGAGLASSVFHLANPKNAWRAVSRYRTSWLSREGVFAMAFFPFALVYLALTWLQLPGLEVVRMAAGGLGAVLAWITIFSTGMIYGCLKTIRQWNSPLVPANYLALGHFSGALILLAIANQGGVELNGYIALVLALLVASVTLKAIYYFWIANPGTGSTIQTATGFTRGNVRLLDTGHTHGTFLTQEFGFQIARKYALLLKSFVFLMGFLVPALMLTLGKDINLAIYAAVATALLGMVVERWLFFAEARHVVNLYHGAQHC
ncbi:DmsC/YnfH family molybdoenzyme membrane anchor subunit [Sulfuriferula sp.]|uniref:dimethyl sulfoxide reductase anchor subunit family protein n=1 Tax=Sulfuriferula sp. TaxID=2025307 RepID=UPI0027316CBC|nr:DmsC/YnfH family molybdoenzyme membrane anchor subunit [Sulfuriferula sp.]MDP2025390.1 DmsC/YnfH family molybdoenzyme membrane anchor subunit [Sulfuriferula sp.]